MDYRFHLLRFWVIIVVVDLDNVQTFLIGFRVTLIMLQGHLIAGCRISMHAIDSF
jgi:hypothetical protein